MPPPVRWPRSAGCRALGAARWPPVLRGASPGTIPFTADATTSSPCRSPPSCSSILQIWPQVGQVEVRFPQDLVTGAACYKSEFSFSVQESVQQASEDDSLDAGLDDMDDQARSSQYLSTSTAEISLPPSEDSDRMSGQVETDDGLGLVQSDTPVGAADVDSTQITSTLSAFSAYGNEVFRMPEPNVHSQVLPSTSEIVSNSPVTISSQQQHISQQQAAA